MKKRKKTDWSERFAFLGAFVVEAAVVVVIIVAMIFWGMMR